MSINCFTFAVAFQKNDLLTCADMAQLVEQRIRNAWVTSSSLVIGSEGRTLRGLTFFYLGGNSSVGRAAASQAAGHGFEPRLPLKHLPGKGKVCQLLLH